MQPQPSEPGLAPAAPSRPRSDQRGRIEPWQDPNAKPFIRIQNVTKQFGDVYAVDNVSLDIYQGEFFALLGPSGCGKTTLLRMLAGFETPTAGRILIDGQDMAAVPPWKRPSNMMFQSYALFPHMTVEGNIAFGLKQDRVPRDEIRDRVAEAVRLVQLEGREQRRPEQLSGGQKQRVALARALAIDPTVLLLDEPFGALDAKVRIELRRWLRRLHDQTGQTTLFVTHDQEEALELADRVVVLKDGRIEQVGTPDEIYSAPASAYVFDFIGRANVIEGQTEGGQLSVNGHALRLPVDSHSRSRARLYVRPHDMALVADGEGLPARVLSAHRLAERITLELLVEGQVRPLELDLVATPDAVTPAPGSTVHVRPLRYRVYSD